MNPTVISSKEIEDTITLAVTQVHLQIIICRMTLSRLIKCSKESWIHMFNRNFLRITLY